MPKMARVSNVVYLIPHYRHERGQLDGEKTWAWNNSDQGRLHFFSPPNFILCVLDETTHRPPFLKVWAVMMFTKVKTQSLAFTICSIYVWRVIVSVVIVPSVTAFLGNSTYSCVHYREPGLLWTRLKTVTASVPASYCGLGHTGAEGLSGSMTSRASQGGWEAACAYSAARKGCGMMLGEPRGKLFGTWCTTS